MYGVLSLYKQYIRTDKKGWSLATHFHESTWWRHQMDTFSALLALCAGHLPVTGEFPAQRRSFDVFFDLRPNQQLSKQWRRLLFETPSRSSWRHCDEMCFYAVQYCRIIWLRLRYPLDNNLAQKCVMPMPEPLMTQSTDACTYMCLISTAGKNGDVVKWICFPHYWLYEGNSSVTGRFFSQKDINTGCCFLYCYGLKYYWIGCWVTG